MAKNQIKTKGFLTEDESSLPAFQITTMQAQEYLQQTMNACAAAIMGSPNYTGPKIDPCKVILASSQPGKKFAPFIVVLPLEVLANGKRKDKNQGDLTQFVGDGEKSVTRLQDFFYTFFHPYMFDKNDENAFFSPDWRRMREVRTEAAGMLKHMRTPKIHRYGKRSYVAFLIDPVRVFHDIATDTNNKNEQFRIVDISFKKIDEDNFEYHFKRDSRQHGNKKYSTSIGADLARKLSGGKH